MKHINIGIFHDMELGKELGKKGTESDILLFNRKKGDTVFTFMCPREEKVSTKAQIMSTIDAAIVSFNEMTPDVGETIIMLNSFGISTGIIVAPYTDPNQLKAMTKGTSLESFAIKERNVPQISEFLEGIEPKRSGGQTVVIVDHAFNVKGVGDVLLGFVRNGTVKQHDKLLLLPANKEVLVRSIQMQDEDFAEAEEGARVGIAVKGATSDEMERGSVICAPGSVKAEMKVKLAFEPNRFYSGGVTEGAFTISVGMQTIPVSVTEVREGSISIESETPMVYAQSDTFLLLDLNAKKLHVVGKGTPA